MTLGLGFRAIIAMAALSFSLTAAEAASQIGKVVAVAGSPSASGPGGDRKLKEGSAVFEDDKVTVGAIGNAQIVLNDNTRLVVGPSSSLLLDRFVMKGGSSAQKVSIKTLRGTFRFITGRSAKSAYDISTSSATIGIRGTGFDFWDKRVSGVAVMTGLVKLCDKGKCVELADTCEVGQAGRGSAKEFVGADAGRVVVNNLPYILDQSPLRSQFHLQTNKCRNSISKYGQFGQNNRGFRDPARQQRQRYNND